MNEKNYVKLVEKFEKEGDDKLSLAKKNAPILKSKLEAKVKALEAQEMEANSDLSEAEERLDKNIACVTREVEIWIQGVRNSEDHKNKVALRLNSIQDSIEWHKDQIKLF